MTGSTMTANAAPRTRRPQNPWEYRHLIWNFAQRDLKARYKGTVLGWGWSLIVPLAVVFTYTLVFSIIFRAVPPQFGSGRDGIFAVWFLVGLVPWSLLAGAITGGIPSLLAAGPLLQKIYIPSFVPILGALGAVLVQSLIEFGVVLVILAILGNIGWTWLLLPLWLALFLVFSASLAYILAVANVHFRDLAQIVTVALQLLFFATPILYPVDQIPESVGPLPLRTLIMLNPVTEFILGFRSLLYDLEVVPVAAVGYATAATVIAAAAAVLVFRRWGRDIGEVI